jgi:hypothetical protein
LLSWGDLAAAAPDVPLERRAGPASDLPAGPPPGPAPVDAVYEAALRVAVQVLVAD